MPGLYPDYSRNAPDQAPANAGARPFRPENFFDPYGSVIDAEDVAMPMLANVVGNWGLDTTRLGAKAANTITGGRFGGKVSSALEGKAFTALDRAQSAIGPAVNFLTAANPSQNPHPNNKYAQLGLDAAAEVVNYAKFRGGPASLVAMPFSGSIEGWENAYSADENARIGNTFNPDQGFSPENEKAIAALMNGADSSWGRGSTYGMFPFNPYNRVSSAMRSERDRVARLIQEGPRGMSDDSYGKLLKAELDQLAELIRAASTEERARANPFSVLTLGGPVARGQMFDTFTGSAGSNKAEKDANTIRLLRETQARQRAHDEHIRQALADPHLGDAVMTF